MQVETKKRIAWSVGMTVSLCVCFILCRYAFFELHGMKEWPLDLLIFGLAVIIIAALCKSKITMLCTVLGYAVGFGLGVLFNADYHVEDIDIIVNDFWIWWTLAMIAFVIVGIAWDIIKRKLEVHPELWTVSNLEG